VDFEFTEEQRELRDTIRGVLEKECPPAIARRVTEDGEGADELWATLVSLDWPALALPESAGGLGYSWVEQGILLEEMGHVAAPGPYLATVSQFAPVLLECGTDEQIERFVRPVASGELTGTLALDEGAGTWSVNDVAATATIEGGEVVLSGTKRFVVDGATADEIAVVVLMDGEVRVVVVPGSLVPATPLEPIDATTPHADLALDGVRVEADRVLGSGDSGAGVGRAVEVATTAVALTTLGACSRIFDMTLAYVKEREQFGVPIGSFQAVKHKMADMYRDRERAAALCHFAALCIAEDDDRRTLAASMAKAAAGDCQRRMVKDGLQLHGGIGYTWENDLHLFLRRARVGDLQLGGTARHERRVVQLTMAGLTGPA
jgi:alkylation response protein AidB-like acyl-CoA dehydrogenase